MSGACSRYGAYGAYGEDATGFGPLAGDAALGYGNHTARTAFNPHCTLAMWQLTKIQWIAVGFAVLLNSILKYVLIAWCNKRATVTEIMMWSVCSP